MTLSQRLFFLISLTLDAVLAGDQCTPHRQTFSLVQNRNRNNVCAPVLRTAIVTTVQSSSECGLRFMKTRPCASYTLFEDTMRCVIYSNNPPSYFELGVPHCWSYVDDKFPVIYDCITAPIRSLFIIADDWFSEFYIDGVNQMPSGGWPHYTVQGPFVIPARARNLPIVIAVKVTNINGGYAGLLASSTDGSLLTDSCACKCQTGITDPNWMIKNYNDSGWGMSVARMLNTGSKQVSSINSSAAWVWNSDVQPPADNVVYFRWNLYNRCTHQ